MGDGSQTADYRSPEEPAKLQFAVEGVHLLRTAMQVQYQLSQMADQKANMLLGVTFVIFTISVGQWRIGQPEPALLVLAAAAFCSALLTVAAVLPSVKSGPEPTSISNILFFGAFTRMDEDDYVDRLLTVITDSRTIGEAFARDIYQNGRVLAFKKFRLVGYAYRVMLSGLLASALTFAIRHGMQLFIH